MLKSSLLLVALTLAGALSSTSASKPINVLERRSIDWSLVTQSSISSLNRRAEIKLSTTPTCEKPDPSKSTILPVDCYSYVHLTSPTPMTQSFYQVKVPSFMAVAFEITWSNRPMVNRSSKQYQILRDLQDPSKYH